MKIRLEQLSIHLSKQLLPAYLLSGEEPFLLKEATSLIVAAGKKNNFLEHRIFQIDSQFDWEKFLHDAFTLSLFHNKELIEVRFVGELPNAAASKALQTYFERLPKHKLLLIEIGKLDTGSQKTAWFKAFDQKGAVIQVWPIERQQLQRWLSEKANQRDIRFEPSALSTFSELVEGNLLGAIQALERLKLLAKDNLISTEIVLKAVDDIARFNIFDLIEALLLGNLKRAYRIFYSLKNESIEPLFILNMLTKEIRLLAFMLYQIQQGQRLEAAMQMTYVPPKKQALLKQVLSRFSLQTCHFLIQKAMVVDQIVKGVQLGDSWLALSELCLGFIPHERA